MIIVAGRFVLEARPLRGVRNVDRLPDRFPRLEKKEPRGLKQGLGTHVGARRVPRRSAWFCATDTDSDELDFRKGVERDDLPIGCPGELRVCSGSTSIAFVHGAGWDEQGPVDRGSTTAFEVELGDSRASEGDEFVVGEGAGERGIAGGGCRRHVTLPPSFDLEFMHLSIERLTRLWLCRLPSLLTRCDGFLDARWRLSGSWKLAPLRAQVVGARRSIRTRCCLTRA